MIGGIYSDQRCPVCGSKFRDNGKNGLVCPSHPGQRATKLRVKFGRKIRRRFANDYAGASRFLNGLRFKHDEGTLDPRDYQPDNPLGFENLALKWLEVKKRDVKPKSYNNLRNYMERAMVAWGNRNVKEIDYAEIEDFLLDQKLAGKNKPISDKTRANINSAMHDFFIWLRKRRILKYSQVPEFPEVDFELGFRTTIDKDTQDSILDRIYEMTFHINPKIWLGIKWLCTYISIRPGELIVIKENQIDLKNGYLILTDTKEKKPKLVPLLDEDVKLVQDIYRSIPQGLPEMRYFRHTKMESPSRGRSIPDNKPFGEKYFYKWWVRACESLGVKGVDLYGGTRHSSAIALRKYRTPEEIKRATMHSTNKAFERYFRIESDELRDIYNDAKRTSKKADVIEFKKQDDK